MEDVDGILWYFKLDFLMGFGGIDGI